MSDFVELIELLKQYLNNLLEPQSFVEIADQYVPIFTAILLVVTAIAGVYKYYRTKNKETYEKILAEVYSPLFEYIVKQEIYCDIFMPNRNISKSPILEISNRKYQVKISPEGNIEGKEDVTPLCDLTRQTILDIKRKINFGLAPKNLVVLLDMYEMLIKIEEKTEPDDVRESGLKALILKVKVKQELRNEIFEGYKLYHKKLGLSRNNKSKLWSIGKENIDFNYSIKPEEVQSLKTDKETNPEKYQKRESP